MTEGLAVAPPMPVRKKLIEVALPLPEINDASAYDKMPGIGPHPKGIHHWWARLPLPTARAVLFASVVDDPAEHPERWPNEAAQNAERERLFDILRRMMGKKLHEHPEVYAEAHAEMLAHCNGPLPTMLDPFSGGGSIPLEAHRLGFIAHARDLNPVAVLLNKCNLELAPRWANRAPANPKDRKTIGGTSIRPGTLSLAADLRYYASTIANQARQALASHFPLCSLPSSGSASYNVIAWIWVRTVASPNPSAQGKHVPLASTFLLSGNAGNAAWIVPLLHADAPDGWTSCVQVGAIPPERIASIKLGTRSGKDFECLLTRAPIPRGYVQTEAKAGRLRVRLLAIVADGPRGRIYLSPTPDHEMAAIVKSASLAEARTGFLAGPLPTRAEITGGVCTAYALDTWGHLFTDRQLLGLLQLSMLVSAVPDLVRKDACAAGLSSEEASEYANTVATFLALAIDRCADFNNVLCRWSQSNQKVMNLFGRQALPMVWDFAEANLLGDSVGAWTTCSSYVADCVEVLQCGSTHPGTSLQTDAASGVSGLSNILVSTDPPYYDNISYATLSDFFYVWMRRALRSIYPSLLGTVFTPKLPELIAAPNRFEGSREAAKQHFESGFRRTFASLRETLDPRFPLTVYYAFKQDDEDGGDSSDSPGSVDLTTGWETLLEALLGSGFQITATWPVRASQKWRMVSMGANALASYIVLACRPRPADSLSTDRGSFVAELKRSLPTAIRHLQQGNIAPVDFAQASIGPGMAVFSRYTAIMESSGKPMAVRTALSLINQTLTEVLSEQEDDFDPDTRWALDWFAQYGFDAGAFGDAEILSKAKVTSVDGLKHAGLIASKSGQVRLLRPEELPRGWAPSGAKRLTVWEATHHLLRVYYHEKGGDAATASLLRLIGALGEIARDLAYRLFNLCDKKKWSLEAQAYNSLVLGWPEVARIARESRAPEQGDLFGTPE